MKPVDTPEPATSVTLVATVDAGRLARRVLLFCLACELALFLLDYTVNFSEWTDIGALRRMFNTTREDGIASWFGVTQTLLTALTLSVIWFSSSAHRRPRWKSAGWLILTGFFLYMAVDDGAQIHERVGTAFDVMRERAGDAPDLTPSYMWQVLFVPLFGAVGLFMFWFLWREIRDVAGRVLLVVAIGCQVLAVGLDFQEGLEPEHPLNVYTMIAARYDFEAFAEREFGETEYDAALHLSQSFEETIEMAAISMFWFLFLRYLSVEPREIQVRFRNRDRHAASAVV